MATYALIIADPNSDDRNDTVSTHRSPRAAHRARGRLNHVDWRWSYVAERRPDGTYPLRLEALEMSAHKAGA